MSLNQVFLIFVHIALQNVFHRPQQALEGITLDVHNSAISLRLDARLPHCILNQRDFPKIVSIFILKHLLRLGSRGLFLLGYQFALGDDVEAVALVTLLDDVAAGFVLFLP